MQFKKSIAATRSALRLGTNLSLPLQAVAPQNDAAHPQPRRAEKEVPPLLLTPPPFTEQLPDKDKAKEQRKEACVCVFSGRFNFLHLKLVYLIYLNFAVVLGFLYDFLFTTRRLCCCFFPVPGRLY